MRILSLSLLFIITLSFVSCKGIPEVKNGGTQTETIDSIMSQDDRELLKKYRQEGFVDLNSYAVIIVRPVESDEPSESIMDQAEKRIYVSFQKYLRQKGVRVDSNTNTKLINLIDEYGSIKRVHDSKESRVVYIFVVEMDGLKRYIDVIK
ncbi:MAG: hypothetical protein PF637_08345 [Spirochaetes bacterium]|nr:hypothetical protein [Spirochaetota bacterium]